MIQLMSQKVCALDGVVAISEICLHAESECQPPRAWSHVTLRARLLPAAPWRPPPMPI